MQNRFKEQPEIYSEFLDILHDYQAKRTIDEVYQRVQKLFGGHSDLLHEFKYFLPDRGHPPTLPNLGAMRRPVKVKKEAGAVPVPVGTGCAVREGGGVTEMEAASEGGESPRAKSKK